MPDRLRRLLASAGSGPRLNVVAHPDKSPRTPSGEGTYLRRPPVEHRMWGSTAVITLPAHVQADSIRALHGRSERALGAGCSALAVDLRAAQHIDAQTLCELGSALQKSSRHKATLAIVSADPRVRWVLDLCGIDGLSLHSSMRRALAELGEPSHRTRARVWRDVFRRRTPGIGRSSAR